ncbi:MAG TPA: hypothetical protein VJR26_11110 [Candidatus Acidoferrales bacterium]|nr:hypothetical protein [Candidatus Acidoferrales bacterium]
MGEGFPITPPPEQPSEERLDSWKEIAAYLKRDITTVQRWEKREGMPVHRHLHDKAGSVYAFRGELDAWTRSRNVRSDGNGSHGALVAAALPASEPRSGRRTRRTLVLAIVATVVVVIAGSFWIRKTKYSWHNPIADARVQKITDFDGIAQAAAISRDGHFIAFLSDRDGPMDVWVTQTGSGEFHNLTRGAAPELVNPSVRTLGFSPDGSLVTFWTRKGASRDEIGIWAVPTLGGEPRPYLQGVAEFDWSPDGTRLAYHTTGPGDPLYVSDGELHPDASPIFTAPAGMHSHFPLWGPEGAFIYVVEGALPDKLDVWRISPNGRSPERITSDNTRVTYPVLLDRRTLLYLATDAEGSGPWLYSLDVARRIPHRLTSGLDRYTSLAASTDGRRLVLTLANPKRTLWRLRIADSSRAASSPERISLTTAAGFAPRLGPDYLLYVSTNGTSDSIWKQANGAETELWSGAGARVIGAPAISRDGNSVAFSVREGGKSLLYVMRADGTEARVVAASLELEGAPAWAPDGRSITSACSDHGAPRLFRVPLDNGSPVALVRDYALDPAWSSDGGLLLYSGPDIGTTFSVKAATADGGARAMPPLTLTRGARHLAFLSGGDEFVCLRGDIEHKNLWLINLGTGAGRQLTNLPAGFDIRDFDISPNGRDVVLERLQKRSDIVLLELARK